MNTIPTKINRYNVYNKGNRLLGVGEEMALPDFEPSSETVTGAGILVRSTTPPWAISAIRNWKSRSVCWTRKPPT